MKTSADWLNAVREKTGMSDYAIAPKLSLSRAQVSRYRKGHDALSDDAAIKIAAMLEIDPLPVVASAQAERAKTPEARGFWERWAMVAAGVVLAVGATAPTPSQAATAAAASDRLYIMSSGRRRRQYSGAAMKAIAACLTATRAIGRFS